MAGSTIGSGDINGDGYSDIIIEASQYDTYRGRVYIIYGAAAELTSANLSTADTIITGEEQYDSIGGTTITAGDINGDNYDDLIIGAQEQSTETNSIAGGAYVIYGEAATLTSINASAADSKITVSGSDGTYSFVAYPSADLNNDGYDDVIIGVPDTTNGTVYVMYGSTVFDATIAAATEAGVIINGEDSGDTFGQAGSTALINVDGFYDLMISAPQEDSIASGAGAIYQINLFEDNDDDGVAGTDGPLDGTDCNDADATVTENQTYYQDSDGDGFGNAAITTSVCSATPPAEYVTNNSDTDDTALGPISSVVVDNGVLTITYESTYSQEVTPFSAGTALQAAVSSDALRIVVTNGKGIRVLFEGEQVSTKALYTTKSKKVSKSKLSVTDFYTNYDSIIYVSVRGKRGRVAVLRLADTNALTTLKKKSVDLQIKNPNRQRLTVKPNKKRFISRFGNGSTKVTNTWKIRSNGNVSQVN